MDETIHYVTVQTRQPRGEDLGQIEEGFYKVDGLTVILVTRTGAPRFDKKGKPIRQTIPPGETARAVAHRLTKQNIPNCNSGWNRKIVYPNLGKI